MTDSNYLLDAVDKLTLKDTSRVMQANEAGISCVSEVVHEPLLIQLREAVVGGIGKHAGSSAARERLPFDAGALRLFDDIVKQVNAWYLTTPKPVEERHLEDRLRDWYQDFENRRRAGRVSEAAEADAIRIVEGWQRSIEAMFDPPVRLELTTECPLCGERFAHDKATGDRVTAIIIEYRNIGAETLDKATGLCRFCAAVWRGRSELRELRWAVDHPEEKTTA